MKFQQFELTNTLVAQVLNTSKSSSVEAQSYKAPELHELGNFDKVQGDWGLESDWAIGLYPNS